MKNWEELEKSIESIKVDCGWKELRRERGEIALERMTGILNSSRESKSTELNISPNHERKTTIRIEENGRVYSESEEIGQVSMNYEEYQTEQGRSGLRIRVKYDSKEEYLMSSMGDLFSEDILYTECIDMVPELFSPSTQFTLKKGIRFECRGEVLRMEKWEEVRSSNLVFVKGTSWVEVSGEDIGGELHIEYLSGKEKLQCVDESWSETQTLRRRKYSLLLKTPGGENLHRLQTLQKLYSNLLYSPKNYIYHQTIREENYPQNSKFLLKSYEKNENRSWGVKEELRGEEERKESWLSDNTHINTHKSTTKQNPFGTGEITTTKEETKYIKEEERQEVFRIECRKNRDNGYEEETKENYELFPGGRGKGTKEYSNSKNEKFHEQWEEKEGIITVQREHHNLSTGENKHEHYTKEYNPHDKEHPYKEHQEAYIRNGKEKKEITQKSGWNLHMGESWSSSVTTTPEFHSVERRGANTKSEEEWKEEWREEKGSKWTAKSGSNKQGKWFEEWKEGEEGKYCKKWGMGGGATWEEEWAEGPPDAQGERDKWINRDYKEDHGYHRKENIVTKEGPHGVNQYIHNQNSESTI